MHDLQETAGNVAWANDNKTLFYVTKDKLDRPFKVSTAKLHYHRLVGLCATPRLTVVLQTIQLHRIGAVLYSPSA